jgi:hypothetical protein
MRGRTVALGLLSFTLVFAASLTYFQFFAFYQRERDRSALGFGGHDIPVSGYDGINASTSPLKLRGCFEIDPSAVAALPPALDATPLTAPFWFGCFDAGRLTEDLAAGRASAHALARDEPEGFDVMLAAYPDGRGYLWRQLGEKYRD